ncbi:MAG: DNA repair protein RadC [Flavobacteriales bacterium]|nr:DNA repair protein RadC [Flavobacteriales bacterium]
MSDPTPYVPINQWSEDDRPREKFLTRGRQALTDAELMAILIGSGSKNESAVDLCRRILADCQEDLRSLGIMSIADLTKYRGIGEAKALTLAAALELGRRRRESEALERKCISASAEAYEIMAPSLMDLPHEEFWVLLLNRANRVITKKQVSAGGISGTVADAKVIFKLALENNSSNLILCHNHPSGNNKPSQTDINLTKRLCEGAKLLDLTVIDHIIIADRRYFSFADEGML